MDKQHFLTNASEDSYDDSISLFNYGYEAMNITHGSLECQYLATQDVDSSRSKALSNQGYGWIYSEDALGMCRSSVDEAAYDASMMSRNAQGFFCDCCGKWALSKISQDAGLKSSWIYANVDATVWEQLVQSDITAVEQSALFETDMTTYFPMFESQSADNSYSNAAGDPNDFVLPYDLFASTNSFVLPEQTVPQASPFMAMSCHDGQGLKRISDTPIQRYKKERAVCPVSGCRTTLSRPADIPRHRETAYGGKKRHPCDFLGCTKSFSRKDKVTSHKRMHGLGGQAAST
ncbi:hypothetical protein L207DRAFT_627766 [Hyaloscypha variabilis F]|uniref:C2H2-type domain-containing protein n=1 Tax=Hyaloscypha variabilis (strain UAMH 11265 / GT02V1 / F) TaxID=1149755 RepID=A0A2J6S8C8_HYAVF|nr:hypothetical protein L207DRAFT_627766 [Hyaloscypha variabilis F]